MNTRTAPRRFVPARDLALIAVFAGVTAALGLIPPIYVPLSPVPISAQSLGPMLAGVILGGRRGFASQLLLLALVGLGLPLLSGGRGGIGVFFGVTWAFLLGWPIVAGLMGWASHRLGAPFSVWKNLLVVIVFGMIALYGMGIPGMVVTGKLGWGAAVLANLPYLPGDLVKAVIAVLVAKAVHSAYPVLLPQRAARPTLFVQDNFASTPVGP